MLLSMKKGFSAYKLNKTDLIMTKLNKPAKRQMALRKSPSQDRAKRSVERILSAATTLLDKHGYDYLTTITIAKEAQTAVGSVYQYFPNKHAIMSTLTQRWLDGDNKVLEQIEKQESQYENFIDILMDLADKLFEVYEDQQGLLALVQLISNIPELYEMENAHDEQYALRIENMIERHNLKCTPLERKTLAQMFPTIVDKIAMTTAGKTDEVSFLKRKFMKKIIRDLFNDYL